MNKTSEGRKGISPKNVNLSMIYEKGGIGLTILIIVVMFTILTKGLFISPSNIINILVQSSVTGIVAIGVTFVILVAGIDLSVSGTVVLSALLGAKFMASGGNWFIALSLMLLVGAAVGLVNGLAVTQVKMVPFVTTLATMNIARGLAKTVTNGKTVFGLPEIHEVFGQKKLVGLPVPILILFCFLVVSFIFLRYTTFGRRIYAIGGNAKTAWMAGIRTKIIVTIAYVVSGVCAAFGAIILTSRMMVGSPSLGIGLELDAIAACVIGGVSLFGGEGGVIGTILGAIIISMINNGLNLMGVTPFIQEIVKGLVIFAVIAIDAIRRERSVSI